MNIWEEAMMIAEATPFETDAQSTTSGERSIIQHTPASPSTTSGRNVQLTDAEIDAILDVMEKSSAKNVKGVDLNALDQKLYSAKVKKEAMGSNGGMEDGETGESECDGEVEGEEMTEAKTPEQLLQGWAKHMGLEWDQADKKVKVPWTGPEGTSGKEEFLWHSGGKWFLKRPDEDKPAELNQDELAYVLQTGKDPETEDWF